MAGLVLIVGWFVIPIVWAGRIAERKGRSKGAFQVLAFFLGWFGVLIAGLVSADRDAAAEHSIQHRPCPHCAERIRVEAVVCRYCGGAVVPDPVLAARAQAARPRAIVGTRCEHGHDGPIGARKCAECGTRRMGAVFADQG